MSAFSRSIGHALGFGAALALAACGGDSSDANGSTSAQRVDPALAQQALNELTSNVDITVTGFRAPASGGPSAVAGAAATPKGGAGTVEVQCAAGGGASVDGHVNVVPLPVMVDVSVAIGFDGCRTANGSTLAGDVDFAQSVDTGAGTPLRVETSYQGKIDFTGAIEASCDVDLHVLVDETGRAVQVTGNFCGQDASQLNLQVMPRWRG